MGDFTGLRFKGVVKSEFRSEFSKIATTGNWDESTNDVFKRFSTVSRAMGIPIGALDYMPDEWIEDDEDGSNGDFRLVYNEETGHWKFQCALKNYGNTVEEFFKIIPYFIESIEHLERFGGFLGL